MTLLKPLAAALLLAVSAGPALGADLLADGWTHIADTADASVFMKVSSEAAAEHRRVFTAFDLDAPREREGFSFRSVRSLSEYDCAKSRTRVIAETFHAGEGLSGKTWSAPDFTPTEWAEVAEGSVGAMRMEFACPPAKAS